MSNHKLKKLYQQLNQEDSRSYYENYVPEHVRLNAEPVRLDPDIDRFALGVKAEKMTKNRVQKPAANLHDFNNEFSQEVRHFRAADVPSPPTRAPSLNRQRQARLQPPQQHFEPETPQRPTSKASVAPGPNLEHSELWQSLCSMPQGSCCLLVDGDLYEAPSKEEALQLVEKCVLDLQMDPDTIVLFQRCKISYGIFIKDE